MADSESKHFLQQSWHIFLAILVMGALTPWLIGPSPPKTVTIATGRADGAYYKFAQKYGDLLAEHDIKLVIQETQGSVENLRLLADDEGDVSLAFVQGGVELPDTRDKLETLGSLYLEPALLFYRGEKVERLTELAGKRISVGGEGSGARALAATLLRDNGLSDEQFNELGGQSAADALIAGETDAALFVTAPSSPLVAQLLDTEGVHLMDFTRAAAYRARHPYLSVIELSEGLVSLEKNAPNKPHTALAPAANLVARRGLHSALVPLLLNAASEIHRQGDLLAEPDEFPSGKLADYPLSKSARQYYQSGPSFLYKYLPFHFAARVDQLKLLAIPLLTLLFPLVKLFPPIYRWRIRLRIYRWYVILREIDQKLKQTSSGEADFSEEIERLKKLELEVTEVSVPLSYMEEFYNMRLHVAFVADLLEERHREGGKGELPAI